jgi:hypothetical protein
MRESFINNAKFSQNIIIISSVKVIFSTKLPIIQQGGRINNL